MPKVKYGNWLDLMTHNQQKLILTLYENGDTEKNFFPSSTVHTLLSENFIEKVKGSKLRLARHAKYHLNTMVRRRGHVA